MKIIYNEWYGNISFAQRTAYRKHNVSPSDHRALADTFGQNAHAEITAAVKNPANQISGGSFSFYRFHDNQD